jgi:protein gp37
VFHEDRLGEPVLVRKPSRVFVCSMGDFWHETVQGEWRIAVGGAMQAAPWHTYIFLTKRPEAIGTVVQRLPENWWYGCTCENQAAVASRWPLIAALPAAVRFVSVEPMLGPVTFHGYHRPDWVIAGPETGPGARDFEAAWIGELSSESRCFFDKRNGEAGRRREWPR